MNKNLHLVNPRIIYNNFQTFSEPFSYNNDNNSQLNVFLSSLWHY